MTNLTADQIELQIYLKKEADEDRASGNMFIVVDSIEHWANNDVYSLNDYHRYNLSATISDVYKDVNGFRPRFYNYDEMSLEEMEQVVDGLFQEVEQQIADEKEYQNEQSRIIQRRKKANSYKPNNALSGLRDLIKSAA